MGSAFSPSWALTKFLTCCLATPGHIRILKYIKIIAVASNIVVQWKTSWSLCVFCDWNGTDLVSGYSEKCHTQVGIHSGAPLSLCQKQHAVFSGAASCLGRADRIPDPVSVRVVPRCGHAGAAWDRWWTRPPVVRASRLSPRCGNAERTFKFFLVNVEWLQHYSVGAG